MSAADEVHPPPEEFTPDEVNADPIMQFFHYSHLPPGLQARSRKFFDLARWVVDYSPRSAERTVCLRKILEAKDAGVRCAVAR